LRYVTENRWAAMAESHCLSRCARLPDGAGRA
jgi:hypothetical protein